MKLLSIDFETYYDTKGGYTLSKMPAEEYIRDPRFQIIGASVKVDDGKTHWIPNHNNATVDFLRRADWSQLIALGHNMSEFDALILTEKVGVRPRGYQCTLAMGRALHGGKTSNALGSLAKMYGLPPKGDEVLRADGKRLEDFSPWELAKYGEYCNGDTDICWMLYHLLRHKIPPAELQIISTCIRMWAEPRLELDRGLAAAYLEQLTTNKVQLLMRAGVTQEELRSDQRFAQLLEDLGVDPPRKYSKKRKNPDGTPMLVYAFAKTDPQMEELAEDEDEEVATLANARLGVKTTIEESRMTRFVGIADRGNLPVPLAYGKTHTNRLAGSGKINMQNMGRVKAVNSRTLPGTLVVTPDGIGRYEAIREVEHKGRRVNQIKTTAGIHFADDCHCVGLRDMIRAPKGKRLVVADSSNIELRVAHCLAGQMDTVEKLHNGADLYCDFATDLYHRPITKADKKERQHGKVAMLQLQYQSGAGSFRNASRIMGGIRLSPEEAETTVRLYRAKFDKVRKFWYTCSNAIEDMANGREGFIDQWGLCRVGHNAIWLPNGVALQYFNLRQEVDIETEKLVWVYDDKEKRHTKKTYGGSITENLCQALARNVVFDQMMAIEKEWGRYEDVGNGVVLAVHDEVVCLVDEADADDCLAFSIEAMSKPPVWWPQLPVAAEGDYAQVYGSAK